VPLTLFAMKPASFTVTARGAAASPAAASGLERIERPQLIDAEH
jgi:hypothetical protein